MAIFNSKLLVYQRVFIPKTRFLSSGWMQEELARREEERWDHGSVSRWFRFAIDTPIWYWLIDGIPIMD